MIQKIGIIYSSVDGQTKKICEHLVELLTVGRVKPKLYSIEAFNGNLLNFDTLIIGASIRYGKHNKLIYKFIEDKKDELKAIQTAFFSVNLVARKDTKNTADTNPYLIKFIKEIDWKPNILAVFAGKLDYKSYPLFDRIMIKLIMIMTHGPTKTDAPIEFTDWNRVKDFSKKITKNNTAFKK